MKQIKEINKNMTDNNGLEKFIERQTTNKKPKGIHLCVMSSYPGISEAGAYIHGNGFGGNIETAKRIHRDILQDMKILAKIVNMK